MIPKPPPPPNPPEWATYVAKRNKTYNLHAKRGHAFNAVMTYQSPGDTMFQFIDNEWVAVFVIPDFNEMTCEYCNEPLEAGYNARYDIAHVRHDKNNLFDIHWYHTHCTPRRREWEAQREEKKLAEARALLEAAGEL